MLTNSTSVLCAEALTCGYDGREVLSGVDFEVGVGEIVTVIGHNGAGKSTLLRALVGLIPTTSGVIVLDGCMVSNPDPFKMLRLGLVYVPQGGQVFAGLSVQENFLVRAIACGRALPRLFRESPPTEKWLSVPQDWFARDAGELSGGEKQVVALAAAIALRPRLLLLDEPSAALSPQRAAELFGGLQALAREAGVGIVVAEQRVRRVLSMSTRVYALRRGRITYAGPAAPLSDAELLKEVYL